MENSIKKNGTAPGMNGFKNGKCCFKILNKIGQGGYGYVFTVEKTSGPDENTVYAMKVRPQGRWVGSLQ